MCLIKKQLLKSVAALPGLNCQTLTPVPLTLTGFKDEKNNDINIVFFFLSYVNLGLQR